MTMESSYIPAEELQSIGLPIEKKDNITIFEFDKDIPSEKIINSLDNYDWVNHQSTIKWINVIGINDSELINKIGKIFNIDTFTTEDILNKQHPPKIEEFEEHIFLVFKAFFFDENIGKISSYQISIVFNDKYVISFQEKDQALFNPVIERIRKGRDGIKERGTDFLVYCLLDTLIDSLFILLKDFASNLEEMEEILVNSTSHTILRCIQDYRKQVLILRQGFWPLREIVGEMQKFQSPFIKQDLKIHLRDLYDHIFMLMETLELYKETVSHMFDMYLSSNSNKMNEVMKVLTIIATIFMPLTFIAGIYGMNFKAIPELEWNYGYPFALVLMLFSAIGMVYFFKRKNWI